MVNRVFTPVLGRRLRVSEVDSSGKVIPGPEGNHIVTEGFITVTLSAEVEDGAEIIQKNANGSLCVNEKQPNSFKRFNVDIELCGVNPALLAMLTNAEVYPNSGDTQGIVVPEGPIEKWVAIELWTGIAGDGGASGYFLLPLLEGGVLGDITVDGENAVTFSVTGASTKGGNQWGDGPWEVTLDASSQPSKLPEAIDPFDHLLIISTGLAVPAHATEPQANPTATG